MSGDVRDSACTIIKTLVEEDSFQEYSTAIKALHNIIPEYPELHWRHLHRDIQDRIKPCYKNKEYGYAADEGVKIYCEAIRNLTELPTDGTILTNRVFGSENPYLKVADTSTQSGENIQKGQRLLSEGLITGFGNIVAHSPMDSIVPQTFSDLDCLNILSLISYLRYRLDDAEVMQS